MSDTPILAGTFVEPRLSGRAAVGRTASIAAFGALGAAATAALGARKGPQDDASPLARGQLAHLGVTAADVVIHRAKRGAFRPSRLDEVVASVPRSQVAGATLDKGMMGDRLEIVFVDGGAWEFDVPKAFRKGAKAITGALAS